MVTRTKNATYRVQDPEPCQTRRSVAMSSKARWAVQTTMGPGGGTIMRPEGLTEYRAQVLAANDPNVVRIEEQFGPVRAFDAMGKAFQHWLDMRVLYKDGTRLGVSVKPERLAQRLPFRERMAQVAAGATPTFIDSMVVMTERNFDAHALRNALCVHGCRRPVPEVDEAVARLVETMVGTVSIADLAAPTGLGGSARRAVIRLIGSGVLECLETRSIQPSSLVRKAGPR